MYCLSFFCAESISVYPTGHYSPKGIFFLLGLHLDAMGLYTEDNIAVKLN